MSAFVLIIRLYKTKFSFFVHNRHTTAINAVRIGDNKAAFLLPKNSFQTYDRYCFRPNNIMQNRTGTDRSQLIRIAYKDTPAMAGQGFQKAVCQFQIEHGNFINNN